MPVYYSLKNKDTIKVPILGANKIESGFGTTGTLSKSKYFKVKVNLFVYLFICCICANFVNLRNIYRLSSCIKQEQGKWAKASEILKVFCGSDSWNDK